MLVHFSCPTKLSGIQRDGSQGQGDYAALISSQNTFFFLFTCTVDSIASELMGSISTSALLLQVLLSAEMFGLLLKLDIVIEVIFAFRM